MAEQCLAPSRGSVREDETVRIVEPCPVRNLDFKFGLYSVSRLFGSGGEV